ncbi:heparan-alpha-glucosaminide N-acetyltransferase domain-containing protein [Streptomonospora sp. S1-112]|uniref:Heparan-alpha-glucosaminide N-acetyltransferase domain-containing protein n=1 Tax=Streptomonospora mangrovi TaxID=2883123 RepID=A0A9X3NYT5_9ACTN|nr:heparan-alpha-glucosaminide N-acetyltransferase domain-containing protein [Streptomonospora mangrovi]MDA0566916.1 heparan-alpha-glucosaminide N-acetyltransferase domain-containing protein [Streptomonospora mangrovi]
MSQHSPQTRAATAPRSPAERIAGIDVARALAVFGMFSVHLGVGAIGVFGSDAVGSALTDSVHELTRGRSSALFAFLAGVSLALMTGRAHPVAGAELRRRCLRILMRALVLGVLGVLLDFAGAPIAIILTYYAGFFLLAIPLLLLRLRAPALAATAAAIAVAGPVASFAIRGAMGDTGSRVSSIGGPLDFLLTGYYPAFTFMAFVVAGMAVGRLDLASARTRLGMVATGAGLALLGYGGSWLLLHPLGGLAHLERAWLGSPDELMYQGIGDKIGDLHGQVPTDTAWYLAVATPHSGTGFEIAGAVGTALIVLAACMAAADVAGRLLYPLAAAGSMPLTIYTGHVLVIGALGYSAWDAQPFRLEAFVIGALVFATVWRLTLGRGPLERLVGHLADTAAEIVPPESPDRAAPRP